MKKAKPKAMLRRFDLILMDKDCNPSASDIIAEVVEEYDIVEESGKLPEEYQQRIQARGDMLDFQKTLLMIAKTPRDKSKGMDYHEMEIISPIVKKIKDAELGDYVLLEEGEWKELCDKAKKPIVNQYSELWFEFFSALMNCKKVSVEESEVVELKASEG